MPVDMHAHLIPEPLLDDIRRTPERYSVRAAERDGLLWFHHQQGYQYPVPGDFYDQASILAALERLGLEQRIFSLSPTLFFYDRQQETRERVCRLYNDAAADLVRRSGGRIRSMAAVPLPDVAAALAELEHALDLGLTGVEIGTNVERHTLDEPEFFPFFRRCAELGVPVFLHPYYVGPKPMMERYYLTNSIGNPLDTAIAIANLIHGGVLERLPGLNVVLAHAGGFFPYQRGRLDHAFRVRSEPRVSTSRRPSDHLAGVYYDSISHSGPALRFLVETVGADRVLLGSDAPFDMGPDDPTQVVREAGLEPAATAAILGGNALRLYRTGDARLDQAAGGGG